jgi:hypothetical protein
MSNSEVEFTPSTFTKEAVRALGEGQAAVLLPGVYEIGGYRAEVYSRTRVDSANERRARSKRY